MIKFIKKYYWIIIALFIVCLDQLTKLLITANVDLYEEIAVIKGFFAITHIHNEGIAFGMLSGYDTVAKVFVIVLTLILIIVASVALIKRWFEHPLGIVSISFIVGGGIGNLIDRITLKYVVDFLAFTFFGKDFAVFNVADIFVTVGTFLFIVYFIFFDKEKKTINMAEETYGASQEISD